MSASEDILTRGRCPDCGSKDNLVTYRDGHQFCYTPGCGLKEKGMIEVDETTSSPSKPKGSQIAFTSQHMPGGLKTRKLDIETLSKFGYFVHKENGKSVQIANYYGQDGSLSHQKYRDAEKNFWFVPVVDEAPKPKTVKLYGQHVWGDKFDKKVVITEGEIDAMSVAQATKFKMAVVSIPAGVGSAEDAIKANYRWLDRFEEIVLWMDNDEPGQKVVPEVAALFPAKVKTIRVEGFKDASEMLQAGREGDVYAAVYAATPFTPEGIINAADCAADMETPEAETICAYPWPKVQEHTLGVREGEVCYHVAGTGIGKTSQLVEIQQGLLDAGVKFGVMRFEDTRKKAQLDLMSLRAGKRLHLEPLPKDEMLLLHTSVFGGGLVELFDPEKASWDFESILGYLRYMAMGLGCKVIFIDPLSFIVAGHTERDERKALDRVAYEFAQFVKHYGVNLQIAHHLRRSEGKAHEEGGQISVNEIRGSGGIANFSMSIFGYERNQQGKRPDLTQIRVLKNRWTGWTGAADVLRWDDQLGRQVVTEEPFETDNEAPSGFGPVESY